MAAPWEIDWSLKPGGSLQERLRIPPEVQAQRDVEAGQLLEAERNPALQAGRPQTRNVVEGFTQAVTVDRPPWEAFENAPAPGAYASKALTPLEAKVAPWEVNWEPPLKAPTPGESNLSTRDSTTFEPMSSFEAGAARLAGSRQAKAEREKTPAWERFYKDSGLETVLGAVSQLTDFVSNPLDPRAQFQGQEGVRNLGVFFKDSMVGRLRQAHAEGKFSEEARKIFGPFVQFGKNVAQSPGEVVKEIVASAREDPTGFAANLTKSLLQDPQLAVAPLGLGGGAARGLATVGGRAGYIGGHALEAGVSGGLMAGATEAAKQFQETGFVSPEGLAGPAFGGAAAGAFLGGAFGGLSKANVAEFTRLKMADGIEFDRAFREAARELGVEFNERDPSVRRAKDEVAALLGGGPKVDTSPATGGSPPPRETAALLRPTEEQIRYRENEAAAREAGVPSLLRRPGEPLLQEPRAPEPTGPVEPEVQALLQRHATDPERGGALLGGPEQARVSEPTAPPPNARQQLAALLKANPGVAAGLAAAGIYLGTNPSEDDAAAVLAMVGGLKARGGAWAPEAVAKLGRSMFRAFGGNRMENMGEFAHAARQLKEENNLRPESARTLMGVDWIEKAFARYLNRYAGTADDPLKNVEMLSGNTWEHGTDRIFSTDPGNLHPSLLKDVRMGTPEYSKRAAEPVWDIAWIGKAGEAQPFQHMEPQGYVHGGRQGTTVLEYNTAMREVQSFLGHVGDYLNQNVLRWDQPLEFWNRNREMQQKYPLDPEVRRAAHQEDLLPGINEKIDQYLDWQEQVRNSPEYQAYRNTNPLDKYDLVKAVKETAENDKRVAREMEKAAKAQAAQLHTHVAYEDGFRWVELKKPDKLTPEQMKGVKPFNDREGYQGWQAIDAAGNPIRNSYTNTHVVAKTPEEAWLGGQLAQEGNQMGHCVGGYCARVASGQDRIFSLRDPQGRSHVTVEVRPQTGTRGTAVYNAAAAKFKKAGISLDIAWGENAGSLYMGRPDKFSLHKWEGKESIDPNTLSSELKKVWDDLHTFPEDIVQIKGKQNRAPDARYQPYVQDFVRGEKWGAVGDLGNTGLERIDAEQAAILGLEGLYHTSAEVTTAALRKTPFYAFIESLESRHPNVSVDLRQSNNGAITLANIELKESSYQFRAPTQGITNVGRGFGQNALRDIIAYADANGNGMLLTAAPVKGGPPLSKLVEIYKRHGFVESPNQPFPDIAVNMYRNAHDLASTATKAIRQLSESEPRGAGQATPEVGRPEIPPEAGAGRPAGAEGPRADGEGNVRGQEAGPAADPLVAAAVAVGAGDALLGYIRSEGTDDDTTRGLGLAAVGAAAGGRGRRLSARAQAGLPPRQVFEPGPTELGRFGLKEALVPIKTRIALNDAETGRRLDTFEQGQLARSAAGNQATSPFMVEFDRLSKVAKVDVGRALLMNDPTAISAAIQASGSPRLARAWQQARVALNQIAHDMHSTFNRVMDNFPRIVDDVDSVKNVIGPAASRQLDARIGAASQRLNRPLTPTELSKIVNEYVLDPLAQGRTPTWAQGRTPRQIIDQLTPFYKNPIDALHSFIHTTSMELEKHKFFNSTGDAHVTQRQGQGFLNTDYSIWNMVDRLHRTGRIDRAQAVEMKSMLEDRFGAGEVPSDVAIQRTRNLTSAALLSNVLSGVSNLADLFLTSHMHGYVNTLASVAQVLTGNAKLTAKELGIVNHLGEELVTSAKSAKFLQGALKYGLFSKLDAFTKDVNLTAARRKLEAKAQTAKGQQYIVEKYSAMYGSDLPQLITDLRARQLTDLTRPFFFSELARLQPISKSEMTQLYLNNPYGFRLMGFGADIRTAYQLQNFMIKQADLMRRDVYEEFKAGNRVKAVKNAAGLYTALVMGGLTTKAIQNFILGKPQQEPEWADFSVNILRNFGITQYALDQVRHGKLGEAVSAPSPATRVITDILTLNPRAVQYLPVVGKLLYNQEWTAEGKARGEERRYKEELRKLDREKPLFGQPSQEQLNDLKRRRRELRSENPEVLQRMKERRQERKLERENQ